MIRISLLTLSAIILGAGIFNTIHNSESTSSAIPAHIHTLYSKWTAKYGVLRATPAERDFRIRNFYRSYLAIQELRKKYPISEFGLNPFSDLTNTEFTAGFTGINHVAPEDQPEEELLEDASPLKQEALPSSFLVPNQRDVGNQGACGGCWAWAIKHVTQDALQGTVEISAQNIMNCNDEGRNCNGGWLTWGIQAVHQYGYRTETDIPHKGAPDMCVGMGTKLDKKPKNSHYLRDPTAFKRQIYESKTGVAITILAENDTWKSFKGGVFDTSDESCQSASTNHGVTLIGWDDSKETFRLRNSWGNTWGDKGFIWIKFNKYLSEPGNCICGARSGDFNCQAINWE